MEEKFIEIYFYDLTKEKQAELIAAWGDNGNYDVIPLAILPAVVDEN